MTLKRYVGNRRLNPDVSYKPHLNIRQVFSEQEEDCLAQYLVQAAKMNYGLSTKANCRLAYEFALANHKVCPSSWLTNKCAGKDWLSSFVKRKQHLALRSPEATSFGRATAFNRPNVSEFFKNLREVRTRYNFGPESIYNVDETELTTVQKPTKVIASRGCNQVGRMTSSEHGTLITACCAVNAIGNSVPPLFIFPRVHFEEFMIKDGPLGCVGFANPSGWMTGEIFVEWLKHFVKYVNCTNEKPTLFP